MRASGEIWGCCACGAHIEKKPPKKFPRKKFPQLKSELQSVAETATCPSLFDVSTRDAPLQPIVDRCQNATTLLPHNVVRGAVTRPRAPAVSRSRCGRRAVATRSAAILPRRACPCRACLCRAWRSRPRPMVRAVLNGGLGGRARLSVVDMGAGQLPAGRPLRRKSD